ncbi:hypothetical protein LV779_31815 [Streptomyces thinghirensis]|nr:hypothetical protein [Streptomyces thinghirensis]
MAAWPALVSWQKRSSPWGHRSLTAEQWRHGRYGADPATSTTWLTRPTLQPPRAACHR